MGTVSGWVARLSGTHGGKACPGSHVGWDLRCSPITPAADLIPSPCPQLPLQHGNPRSLQVEAGVIPRLSVPGIGLTPRRILSPPALWSCLYRSQRLGFSPLIQNRGDPVPSTSASPWALVPRRGDACQQSPKTSPFFYRERLVFPRPMVFCLEIVLKALDEHFPGNLTRIPSRVIFIFLVCMYCGRAGGGGRGGSLGCINPNTGSGNPTQTKHRC